MSTLLCELAEYIPILYSIHSMVFSLYTRALFELLREGCI